MKIIVAGSLAYDRIMTYPNYFSEHLLPDKLHDLNVCFTVDGIEEKFGGTAGNIAYALNLMGERPLISATIGQDYQRYFNWLKKNGISTEGIKIIEEVFTAGGYITTDESGNQITIFNLGAMAYSSSLDFNDLDPEDTIVIISPTNLNDMIDYPRQCKAKGIEYIFDPGQQINVLAAEDLVEAVEGCRILITNDYELDMIINKTGLPKEALLERAESIIVTLGDKGSLVSTPYGVTNIPPVTPKVVKDPTGAGDSYRGGLLCGLVRGMELEECAMMGSTCASISVECYGTQEYRFSLEEFEERFSIFK